MKFLLVDKLVRVSEDHSSIETVKTVSLAEEYLAEHFESFPVLPGVMMLECAVQSAAWLLHLRRGFADPLIVLKEARNVRYGRFVAPGCDLRMTVTHAKDTDAGATFKVSGLTGDDGAGGAGGQAITGKLELVCSSVAGRGGDAEADARLLAHHRREWQKLTALDSGRDSTHASTVL